MKIYTGGTNDPEKLLMLRKYDVGIMISSMPNILTPKHYGEFSCALDNGAFACHRKGYPFQEEVFFKTISSAYKNGIVLDFIVCPDIVCGGKKSLKFSMEWSNKLIGTPNLALAVQDGVEPKDILNLTGSLLSNFTYIFVGGSPEWKKRTSKDWVSFAHNENMKCHIGQIGTLDGLRFSEKIGADSVDSTSFVRNGSWHILENFYNETSLFKMTNLTAKQEER